MSISFTVSADERALINKIARRAVRLNKKTGGEFRASAYIKMDVIATHLNGCRLDLERLLAADDFNFGHDVWGIERHLDRDTGRLLNHFVPRFRQRSTQELAA